MEQFITLAEQVVKSEVVFSLLFVMALFYMTKRGLEIYKESTKNGEMREQYIMKMHNNREVYLQEVLKQAQQESAAREERLMNQLNDTTTQQTKISATLESINRKLDKMDDNFGQVWKEIHDIKDRNKKGGE